MNKYTLTKRERTEMIAKQIMRCAQIAAMAVDANEKKCATNYLLAIMDHSNELKEIYAPKKQEA